MGLDSALKLLKEIWPAGKDCNHREAAEAIKILEDIKDRFTWVPCSERLPDVPGGDYHCSDTVYIWSPHYSDDWVGMGFYCKYPEDEKEPWCDWESMCPLRHQPTHWMPGPKPPTV